MKYLLKDWEAAQHPMPSMGGKALALANLTGKGFPVPQWAVLMPQAFWQCVSSEISPAFDPSVFDNLTPSPLLREGLENFLKGYFIDVPYLAVRSSALEEDHHHHSFAGILESHLYVPHHQVLEAIFAVWKSGFSPRAQEYRKSHGLTSPPQPPAVILQAMVPSEVSGVCFAQDPITHTPHQYHIASIFGLGELLVSGEGNADTTVVHWDNVILSQQVSTKTHALVFSPEANQVVKVPLPPDGQNAPSLTHEQAVQIKSLCQSVSQFFKKPQDMEWAWARNQLYLLQSRPITTHHSSRNFNGSEITHWSRETLIESWPEPTSRLTASWANLLVGSLYPNLAWFSGFPKIPFHHLQAMGKHLVHSQEGYLYLNQSALDALWFQSPSFEYRLSQWQSLPWTSPTKFSLGWKLLWKRLKLASAFWGLETKAKQWCHQVNTLCFPTSPSNTLEENQQQLKQLYDFVETHWALPAQLGFLVQMLPKALAHPLGDTKGTQMVRGLSALARTLQTHEKTSSPFQSALKGFLESFGAKSPLDLYIERPFYQEEPSLLMSLIHSFQGASSTFIHSDQKVPWHLRWLIRCLGNPVVTREELRYGLSQLSQRLRQLALQIGNIGLAEGWWTEPSEVFNYSLSELLTVSQDKPPKAHSRSFQGNRTNPPPLVYSSCQDIPDHQWYVDDLHADSEAEEPNRLLGTVAAPGQCEGTLVWVEEGHVSPQELVHIQNPILAATQGTPGLVPLFPLFKGIVLEVGSPLSHAAIVARELNIPTLVGVRGLHRALGGRKGSLVQLNADASSAKGSLSWSSSLSPLEL